MRTSLHLRFTFVVLATVIFIFSEAADVGAKTGTVRLYLYQSGTGNEAGGVDDIEVVIGDTLSVDVFLDNSRREKITGISIYLTVPGEYFRYVPTGKYENEIYQPYVNPDSTYRPFIQGTFMQKSNPMIYYPKGNQSTDFDNHMDNNVAGWQLDYIELAGFDAGSGRPSSDLRTGVAATFQLVAVAQ